MRKACLEHIQKEIPAQKIVPVEPGLLQREHKDGTRQKPKKRQGKREEDLSGLPVVVIEHFMPEEELEERFGKDGFKQLPDRRFDEAVKALTKTKQKESRAYLALTMIQAICREEKLLKDLPAEERKIRRQLSVRPLVEAYFTWAGETIRKVQQKRYGCRGKIECHYIQYCRNSESQ